MGSLGTSENSIVVLYADDVTLLEPIKKGIPANDLHSVQEWINVNKMTLNLDKSQQMIFYRRGNVDVQYPCIPVVRELKLLGVYWNDKLTWYNHVSRILKLASQRLYVIRVLKSILPREQLIVVYHSLISSIFLYASPLFVSLPQSLSYKIDKFQNRAHRVICGKNCKCSNFPPLDSVR